MPPVSASGTPAEDERRVADRAEGRSRAAGRSGRSRSARRSASRCFAATRFSNCPPHSSQVPGGQLRRPRSMRRCASATKRADVAAAHVRLHDDAPLAVLAADLVRPFGELRSSRPTPSGRKRELPACARRRGVGRARRTRSARARAGSAGSRATRGRARNSSGRRTTRSKRRSPSKTWPASRPPTAIATTSCTSATLRP